MNEREEFLNLLETYNSEQDIQGFLEQNTKFIPREFVQNHGVHNRLVFRKLKLAENYTTDFFYLSKSSDDWNCVLKLNEKNTKFRLLMKMNLIFLMSIVYICKFERTNV